MFVKTVEDKIVNLNQYKYLYVDVVSEAHGTAHTLMISDYENSECLGAWESEAEIESAIRALEPSLDRPANKGYVNLNVTVPSTASVPVQKKK